MASTSASSVQKSFKYDVFLSFRGEDVRKTFVDHLYLALVNKCIITYKDDEKIDKGERINEQLIRSIKDSRYYIIVFSKNYASSSWCLNELVEIMKCQKMTEHTAYPIFFDVEPTEVRNQSGEFGEAFAKLVAKHEKGSWMFPFFKLFTRKRKRTLEDVDLEKENDVGRWRNALEQAAGLAGMELKTTFNGHEYKFIKQIVEKVSQELHFFNSSIDENLVGMETRVKNVVSSLETDVDDVRIIGIWGMGGGGKTTLARAVFDYISVGFEGKSFIENVREVSNSSSSGLKKLQKQVLKDVLNDDSIHVANVFDGKSMMKRMLCSRKVLLVLDDVDKATQLEALAGEPSWFKPGSRIIITTRDEHVLTAHQVNFIDQGNFIHVVSLLSQEEAICLFRRYAFKRREIPNQRYEDLSQKVVDYAHGLPLTIKILGSHLCGRCELVWEDAIKRLETIPLKGTLDILELSYNSLENDEKEIFLDIACILHGYTKKKVIRILESCGYDAVIGLSVLEQKSLITIVKSGGFFYDVERVLMHDHIKELGMNIVRRLHPREPKRHSRLWIKEEIEVVLVNESVNEEIKCIRLHTSNIDSAIIYKGFGKMKELRLLSVEDVEHYYRKYEVDEVSHNLPDSLQSLDWRNYPFYCLPTTFQANELVNLQLVKSNISEFWEGGEIKVLNKLKFLKLSGSKVRTFDLTLTPHLEELNLDGCAYFVELQFSVKCLNLKFLNLSGSKVRTFDLMLTPHLEELNLGGCRNFVELQFSVECKNLKFLNLSNSKVSKLDLGLTPNLERLDLTRCKYLHKIHAPVGCLKRLVRCVLTECSTFRLFAFKKVHESTDLESVATYIIEASCVCKCLMHPECNLPLFFNFRCKYDEPGSSWSGNLEKLISSGFGVCACKNIEYLSATICGLQHLRKLTLEGSIPRDLCKLESLEKLSLQDEKIQHLPGNIFMLKHLKSLKVRRCWGLKRLPKKIWRSECLEELYISSCKSLRGIPNNICKMKCLKRLHITFCDRLEELPEEIGCLECLEELKVTFCHSLRDIPDSICKIKSLKLLELYGCSIVKELPEEIGCLECLENLNLGCCETLREIPKSICKMKSLKLLYLHNCLKVEELPEELGCLECLEELDLSYCDSLRDIPKSICKMKSLKLLDLEKCLIVEELPEELGCLECLEKLNLRNCSSLREIPKSICKMKSLKLLNLHNCLIVKELPEELGCLECLEELNLENCRSLRDIPKSICKMKSLKLLDLEKCWIVEELPEELGCLECLEELNLGNCRSLRDIPKSICKMKKLKRLFLNDCFQVEKLPEELGRLESLVELCIEDSSRLPQSIYQLKRLRIMESPLDIYRRSFYL